MDWAYRPPVPRGSVPARAGEEERSTARKGTNGVSINWATANLMLFDRGTFWVLVLTYFYLPQSARAYLFPQSVKTYYFCSGPISVDPSCPQPRCVDGGERCPGPPHSKALRPISLLRLSLLRFADSNFSRSSLWTPYGHENSAPEN